MMRIPILLSTYLEVGDRLGDGAAEEADLDLLVDLLSPDGDLEEHLVRHLQIEKINNLYLYLLGVIHM